MNTLEKLNGMIPPLITPIDKQGEVCEKSVRQLIEFVRSQSVALMPTLSSGEGWALSGKQFRDMIRYTVRHANGLPVLPGVEYKTTEEVIEKALVAKGLGADAITITTPFRPKINQEEIFQHFKEIKEEIDLPLFIYNEAAISGNEITYETMKKICELGNVIGIKEASGSAEFTRKLLDLNVPVFQGWEHLCCSVKGVSGYIVPLLNLEPQVCNEIFENQNNKNQKKIDDLCKQYNITGDDWYIYLKKALLKKNIITSDKIIECEDNTNENQILRFMEENKCNEIHIQNDEESGCVFIIALNSAYAEKGNGGTRMLSYPTFLDGVEDATKLIDVMTKKCVIIGKEYNGGYSGGKGVIIGDPKRQKTHDMLRRYGKFVQSLHGKFQTGTDMNINQKDIEYMAETSEHIDGLDSGLGDTAIPTAFGIYTAIKSMCEEKYGNNDLAGKTIAVQGVGNVGKNLVKRLVDEGAHVIISDINQKTAKKIKKQYDIKIVEPDEISSVKCDIFSPNACGNILTDEVIESMQCDMIIGSANNPLSDGLHTVFELEKKNITYVPDYVINIGGALLSMCEAQEKDIHYVFEKTKEIIETKLQKIRELSADKKITLYQAAEDIVMKEMSNEEIEPTYK